MARSEYRKGGLPFEFVPIPKDVLRSQEWHDLPPNVVVLVLDLALQYTGRNNGRLCPSFEAMQRVGWKSEKTLIRAKHVLLECSFVVHTRKGHLPRTADWVGFTWWRLDWEKSMDIEPRGFPFLNFVTVDRIDPNPGRAALRNQSASCPVILAGQG